MVNRAAVEHWTEVPGKAFSYGHGDILEIFRESTPDRGAPDNEDALSLMLMYFTLGPNTEERDHDSSLELCQPSSSLGSTGSLCTRTLFYLIQVALERKWSSDSLDDLFDSIKLCSTQPGPDNIPFISFLQSSGALEGKPQAEARAKRYLSHDER